MKHAAATFCLKGNAESVLAVRHIKDEFFRFSRCQSPVVRPEQMIAGLGQFCDPD